MTCGNCGHDDAHGRRGHGSCSHREWSAYGRAEAEKTMASMKSEGKPPAVQVRVLETMFELSGMHTRCECKRKTKRPTRTGDGTPTKGGT